MQSIKIYPLEKTLNAEITVPGSLSYTIRALALAGMTQGEVTITNALKSDDTYAMVTILQTLGIAVTERENCFIVRGSIADVVDTTYQLNAGISGRTARTMLALACVIPGIKLLTCDPQFEKRPIGDLVDGLRQLGATIAYVKQEGFLPVKIISSKLNSGTVTMKGDMSSQYISALLLIAPLIREITIDVVGEQASKAFIAMTIEAMQAFGIAVTNHKYKKYHIAGNQVYKNPHVYAIESDATAASYFWAIAAITKSRVKVLQIHPQSKQGDIGFVDVLEKMGCEVEKNEEQQWIRVTGKGKLVGIEISMQALPDVVPTLTVVAAFAKGTTTLTDIAHLKIKESDRIEAPKNELLQLGIIAEATNDSLTIQGGQPHEATIETYGDHRMAMAFAIAGTKVAGIKINNPEVVTKSFPNFWEKLEEIGVTTQL